MGIEAENKKFPSNDITNPKIYAMRMYSNETEYGIHTLVDRTRGLRSRTSVVDVVVRQRLPQGRVFIQPDDECHMCSTSRLYRLVAKKTSPPSSGSAEAAEEGKADPELRQHSGVRMVEKSPS